MTKMAPPRGPPGHNGTQGPVDSPGPSGPRGSPGPGANFTLCRYRKKESSSVTSDTYAKTSVEVTEEKVGEPSYRGNILILFHTSPSYCLRTNGTKLRIT